MTTSEPTLADDSVRFPSLDSLRAAHSELLKEFRTGGSTAEMNAKIEAFIRRGRATGALLDVDADHWAAQSQLDAQLAFARSGRPDDGRDGSGR